MNQLNPHIRAFFLKKTTSTVLELCDSNTHDGNCPNVHTIAENQNHRKGPMLLTRGNKSECDQYCPLPVS